jgi:hypothetical protein
LTETHAPIRCVRAADRISGDEPVQLCAFDLAPILGDWKNSNSATLDAGGAS